jgi:hypothetical protein
MTARQSALLGVYVLALLLLWTVYWGTSAHGL